MTSEKILINVKLLIEETRKKMDRNFITPIQEKRSNSCPRIPDKSILIRTPLGKGKELFPETPEKPTRTPVCPDAPKRRGRNLNNGPLHVVVIPFPII
jgi:hypothetical protein